MRKFYRVLSILIIVLILSGCKNLVEAPEVGHEKQLAVLDSVDMLFKDVFLWNDQMDRSIARSKFIHEEFNSKSLRDFINESSLSALNPATTLPFEFDVENIGQAKYSTFVEHNSTLKEVFDFGLAITTVPSNSEYRILYVKNGSLANNMGLRRSDKVVNVNGRDIVALDGDNTAFIKSALQQDKIDISLQRANDRPYHVTLLKERKVHSEILKDTIIKVNGYHPVGYLALKSFPALSQIKIELDEVFRKFSATNVIDLIIDLRYNSGGYVSTSRYLSNLIAPKNLEGKKMYHLEYNDQMQKGKQKFLNNFKVIDAFGLPSYKDDDTFFTYADYDYSKESNTYNFEKKGNLEGVKAIYFIVSKQTASAAELLINNLRPYLSVKLIGHNTYGKPVGFFAIDINKFSVYLSSFLALNVKDEGDYYSGLQVDAVVDDNVLFDFGTAEDPAISTALFGIKSSSHHNNIQVNKGKESPKFVDGKPVGHLVSPQRSIVGMLLDEELPTKQK